MTASIWSVNGTSVIDQSSEVRPSKRLKVEESSQNHETDGEVEESSLPPHPLLVRPRGNAYADVVKVDLRSNAGLFSQLPDELLTHFLDYLSATCLISLGSTCKALYAFASSEDLWKALFIEASRKTVRWLGTWRSTYLSLPQDQTPSISCHGLFSDVLYRPFFCAHTPLGKYATNIPRRNLISRLENLTPEEFSSKWSDKPFILTAPVKEWPIYSKWTTESLLQDHGDVVFRAEAVDWPLSTYASYMHHSNDESPVYLFDRSFVEKMKLRVGKDVPGAAYWVPECFGEDLFAVLGDQRPDSRWMIMGPSRSGSTFHKDPNATSAWNAVLAGSKYWLMFPSGSKLDAPPGVILSEDASEITSPLSIAEYLLSFHDMARLTPGCREGICHAGEVLHVPSGWFHLVLNLDESIALTQNFVPRRKLAQVLRFLRDCPEQVSGFRDEVTDPYALFVEKLREKHPDLLEEELNELERKGDGKKGRKWEELVRGGADGESGSKTGFSFGFRGDDDDDDDDHDDDDAEIP